MLRRGFKAALCTIFCALFAQSRFITFKFGFSACRYLFSKIKFFAVMASIFLIAFVQVSYATDGSPACNKTEAAILRAYPGARVLICADVTDSSLGQTELRKIFIKIRLPGVSATIDGWSGSYPYCGGFRCLPSNSNERWWAALDGSFLADLLGDPQFQANYSICELNHNGSSCPTTGVFHFIQAYYMNVRVSIATPTPTVTPTTTPSPTPRADNIIPPTPSPTPKACKDDDSDLVDALLADIQANAGYQLRGQICSSSGIALQQFGKELSKLCDVPKRKLARGIDLTSRAAARGKLKTGYESGSCSHTLPVIMQAAGYKIDDGYQMADFFNQRLQKSNWRCFVTSSKKLKGGLSGPFHPCKAGTMFPNAVGVRFTKKRANTLGLTGSDKIKNTRGHVFAIKENQTKACIDAWGKYKSDRLNGDPDATKNYSKALSKIPPSGVAYWIAEGAFEDYVYGERKYPLGSRVWRTAICLPKEDL